MITNVKDLLAGLIFIAIAAAFALTALNYDLGSAFRMGPAYFPLVLSGLLAFLGVLVAVRGFTSEGTPLGGVPWRGLILVLGGPILFGLTVRGLGLAPAIALVALMGAFASRLTNPVAAVIATVVITIFCILVFWYGLGIPLRLFGPWLGA